jgi:hypothetical protein
MTLVRCPRMYPHVCCLCLTAPLSYPCSTVTVCQQLEFQKQGNMVQAQACSNDHANVAANTKQRTPLVCNQICAHVARNVAAAHSRMDPA